MFSDADYGEHVAASYQHGQGLPPRTLNMWLDVFARHVGPAAPDTVIDLGCGTGRFTPLLADRFGARVFGVEPSEPMLEVARESHPHPRVTYLQGQAERIPLPDSCAGLLVLFQVVQHFSDPVKAAAEIARVLRPGGTVVLHAFFAGQNFTTTHSRYFPGAHAIEEARLPRLDDTVAQLRTADLRLTAAEQHVMDLADGLRSYAERMSHRALSIFQYLPEEEIEAGLARLHAEAARETHPAPVRTAAQLIVLRKPPFHGARPHQPRPGRRVPALEEQQE
ncbi:methyltransferase domain-containing protein [Streptomyces sp. NBC_00454]|uniref:class I SAM-dependent methyltransferase n=1 Tax=Streptomyces sp. NBC_00454 TaxID=2975747 RepID=UPI00324F518A